MSREVHVRFCENLGVQFPGATHPHMSRKNRLGRFTVRRKTIRKRMVAKLRDIKQQFRERMHDPVCQTGQWLKSIVQGHFNYYAVPGNLDSLSVFRDRLTGQWWRTLRRRSQTRPISWTRTLALADRWLPRPRVLHPYPRIALPPVIRDKNRMR
jgi:RNA-directed DNA polymerase